MKSGAFFGSLLGWYLAGPAGGFLGGFLGAWFHQSVPEMQDVLQELLGSMSADAVIEARNRIKQKFLEPLPETYRNKIQTAVQSAFREAIAEMASTGCLKLPQRRVPTDVVYLVSALKTHHPLLADQVCRVFVELYDSAEIWFPDSTALDPVTFAQSHQTINDLNASWLEQCSDRILSPHSDLLAQLTAVNSIYDLRAHLNRHLYQRMMAHLGYQLQRDPELWRVYTYVFGQNLLATLDQQTERLEKQIQAVAPTIFHTATAFDSFATNFEQLSALWDERWEQLIERQQQLLKAQEQFQQATRIQLDQFLHNLVESDFVVEWISPEQISPIEPPDRNLVVGQTIEIRQVRENRFMPRPRLVQDLLDLLDETVAEAREQRERGRPQLFTLWINGRSGSGKSVLALQLMQRLVLERHAPVLWLQDNSAALPEVIKRWPRYNVAADQPVFIFLDDFYAVQFRQEVDLQPIARALRLSDAAERNWPILVTCSPPENVHRFLEDGHEGFALREWQLQPVPQRHFQRVADWYTQQTGQPAQHGPAFEQAEGLFVSMMVELEHGDLAAFAQRFKGRLERVNLAEPLTPFLALNRLYLWPPVGWLDADLSEQQRDAFDLFNRDNDFLLNRQGNERGYVRLTHPHLSDAIYRAIRPDYQRRQRSADLAVIFKRALNEHPTLASLLLRTIVEELKGSAPGRKKPKKPKHIVRIVGLISATSIIWRCKCGKPGRLPIRLLFHGPYKHGYGQIGPNGIRSRQISNKRLLRHSLLTLLPKRATF